MVILKEYKALQKENQRLKIENEILKISISCPFRTAQTVDILSEHSNDSPRNIHRFICLTELLSDLLQMADEKKLSFNPAVEISYLKREEQGELLKQMGKLEVVSSLEQAKN